MANPFRSPRMTDPPNASARCLSLSGERSILNLEAHREWANRFTILDGS